MRTDKTGGRAVSGKARTALVGRGVSGAKLSLPPPEPVAQHLQAEQARPAREPAKVVEDRYRTCWELHAIEQTRYGRRPLIARKPHAVKRVRLHGLQGLLPGVAEVLQQQRRG